MSVERTIYPYKEEAYLGGYSYLGNQKAAELGWSPSEIAKVAKEENESTNDQFSHPEADSDGYVAIQNYVPQFPLLVDSRNLADPDHNPYNPYDLITGLGTSGDRTDYANQLIANPDYSDEEFMQKVHENGDKIHGVSSTTVPKGKTIDTSKVK